MIHLLHTLATHGQLQDMLEVHRTYIKVAVDVRQGTLAGGGEFHADCQTVLRPTANNRSMELQDPTLRAKVEAVIRHLMGAS